MHRRRRRQLGRHRGGRRARRRGRTRSVRCLRSHFGNGFGFAVRAGLEAFEGDAVAIVMADGSDDPADLVLYHELLEEGYDCAFGSRFLPGATITRLPAPQARHQPRRQLGHPGPVPPPLQRHDERLQGLPARGDRGRPAAALEPLQPDRRAAAEGDRARLQLRGLPDLVARALGRGVEARPARDGQPLPVHRPLRLPRAPPEPRRLPPAGRSPSRARRARTAR